MSAWTKEQLRVIESEAKEILVSASAGSGKTSVMIERIARLLISGRVQAENLLIVTFTKAAAAEMKSRLALKLTESRAAEIHASLPFAEIGTLHGFCAGFIRTFFYKAGLDPACRVLDEPDARALKSRAGQNALAAAYEKDAPGMSELADILAARRGDSRLLDIVARLYDFSHNSPDPDLWLTRAFSSYTGARAELLAPVIGLTAEFGQEYRRLKAEKGALDYADLERVTLELLSDEEALAAARAKYKYVFVDEYQDINPVQEAIISRVSEGNNLFMVGDAKQSIYGFRACDPGIFIEKSRDTSRREVIRLNANFRSRPGILEYCNDLFSYVMRRDFGGTDYKNESLFVAGADYPKETRPCVEVYAIRDYSPEDEAAVIARKLAEFMDMPVREGSGVRPARYGDAVILARSMTSHPRALAVALAARGIPVRVKSSEDCPLSVRPLFEFLKVLDNFRQDIPLAALLRSVFFRFSDNELALIRQAAGRRTPFCDAVTRFPETNGEDALAARVREFLKVIEEMSGAADTLTCAGLIEYIVDKFDYKRYMLSFPEGAAAVGKLQALIARVAAADVTLSEFAENPEAFFSSFDDPPEEEPDRVRLTTVHSVKGKEYPFVILCDAGNPFSGGRSEAAVFDRELGAAVRLPGEDADEVYEEVNAARRAREKQEETRILYVALTRAKERLVVTGALPKLEEGEAAPSAAGSYMEWILRFRNTHAEYVEVTGGLSPVAESCETAEVALTTDFVYLAAVAASLGYRYPYGEYLLRPAKTTVTVLNKEETESLRETLFGAGEPPKEYEPEDGLTADPETRSGSREAGNVYHAFFRGVDFSLDSSFAEAEIARLVAEQAFTPEEAAGLDLAAVRKFMDGNVPRRARAARRVLREESFTALREGGGIVQGMPDLVIIEDGGIVICDYKLSGMSAATLKRLYRGQLRMYSEAVSAIFGLPVREAFLYSVFSGAEIPVEV